MGDTVSNTNYSKCTTGAQDGKAGAGKLHPHNSGFKAPQIRNLMSSILKAMWIQEYLCPTTHWMLCWPFSGQPVGCLNCFQRDTMQDIVLSCAPLGVVPDLAVLHHRSLFYLCPYSHLNHSDTCWKRKTGISGIVTLNSLELWAYI